MSRPKLLLADDSVAIRKVVELTFADEGIEVFAVGDAQTAMEKFVEVQPDIVLVDAGLEGTSGYQICEMIKTDEATQHIPVLLLVGSFEPFDHDAAELACADGFMTKPFQSIRELVNRVSELLGRTDPAVEPAEDNVADIATAATVPVEDGIAEMATVPGIDTADIDDLYSHSFHETVKIDEFDTLEDAFDDDGTDDELIEAMHPSQTGPDNGWVETPAMKDDAGTVKEFDWSPTAKIAETEPAPADETSSHSQQFGVAPSMAVHDESLAKEVDLEELRMLDPVQDETSPPEKHEEPYVGDTETAEPAYDSSAVTEHVFPQVNEEPKEPSEEVIALIVQRVIDQLSDRVVREVAVEAVPRIAEKLIREALDPERKN